MKKTITCDEVNLLTYNLHKLYNCMAQLEGKIENEKVKMSAANLKIAVVELITDLNNSEVTK